MNPFTRKTAKLSLLSLSAILLIGKADAQNVKTTTDVVYAEATDKENKPVQIKLDAYVPENSPGKHPAIIMIHGGGWFAGDKAQYKPWAQELAKAGYVAFSINYRLSPRFQYPAALDDVQSAVRWIRAHATEYGVDTEKIGAIGDSAGAHLASFLGTRDTRDNSNATLAAFSSRVRCVVDLFPPTDFTLSPDSVKEGSPGLFMLQGFFGKKPQEAPELYKAGSPITYVDKTSSPFLIFHGDADKLVPVDQSMRFHAALKTANVESTLVIFANEGHGFKGAGALETVKVLSLSFFNRILKGK